MVEDPTATQPSEVLNPPTGVHLRASSEFCLLQHSFLHCVLSAHLPPSSTLEENMNLISFAAEIFQLDRSCLLNDDDSKNMPYMFVTDEVFQADKSWLNFEAPQNMFFMVLTAEVFQADKSWLNCEASENILDISVTADVSQDEMLPLKVDAS